MKRGGGEGGGSSRFAGLVVAIKRPTSEWRQIIGGQAGKGGDPLLKPTGELGEGNILVEGQSYWKSGCKEEVF